VERLIAENMQWLFEAVRAKEAAEGVWCPNSPQGPLGAPFEPVVIIYTFHPPDAASASLGL
jgi:hypothetical protein